MGNYLTSHDGTQVSLKDYHRKWVVVYFYPKDVTQGCTIEAHNFQRDLAKYQKGNAVKIGEFCANEALHSKLLTDTDEKEVEQYGSLRNPPGMALRNTS